MSRPYGSAIVAHREDGNALDDRAVRAAGVGLLEESAKASLAASLGRGPRRERGESRIARLRNLLAELTQGALSGLAKTSERGARQGPARMCWPTKSTRPLRAT